MNPVNRERVAANNVFGEDRGMDLKRIPPRRPAATRRFWQAARETHWKFECLTGNEHPRDIGATLKVLSQPGRLSIGPPTARSTRVERVDRSL